MLKPRKEVDASVVIELEKWGCEEDSVANTVDASVAVFQDVSSAFGEPEPRHQRTSV